MSANQWGERFRITTFGESHGVALGVVIDGCPAGLEFDLELLKKELGRRRPGASSPSSAGVVSGRNEPDEVEILSGVFDGQTLGSPIAMVVRNKDQRSSDYQTKIERAGHADDVWKNKFSHSDYRGGGRSSGRETVARVLAGSVAQMLVNQLSPKTRVIGFSKSVGPMSLTLQEVSQIEFQSPDDFSARFPSARHEELRQKLESARSEGKSYGGELEFWVQNPPPFLGQPVFHKIKSDLAMAVMSVGATSYFEIGSGREAINAEGSVFHSPDIDVSKYGGVRGGITTGEKIIFRVGIKPTSSVGGVAQSGRHDPYIGTRAIPVIESMIWLVLAEHLLWQRQDRV